MSAPLSTYSFLPYLRQGLANHLAGADNLSRTGPRGSTEVVLRLDGEKTRAEVPSADGLVAKNIQLYGPGDVIGLDPRAVVRTEPNNWITNFEPNYLPAIEFYDEDFPWRYTPAAPDEDKHRLRPWITLVVLEEGEFLEGKNDRERPLPFVTVAEAEQVFPRPDQLWAWAHVHVNRSLFDDGDTTVSDDTAGVQARLQAVLGENPDLAYSRIVCPRKLKPNQAYHAFLIPTFESGRLAGLGLDPGQTPRTMLTGWEAYPGGSPTPKAEANCFPYYHRWYFHTGTVGDFEYLVRLLTAKPVDGRVGHRDMDAANPGQNLPGVPVPLKLGGALMAPFSAAQNQQGTAFTENVWEGYENWDQAFPVPFQESLAKFINLADEYTQKKVSEAHADVGPDPLQAHLQTSEEDGDPDPVITPPLYGRWHALNSRLLFEADGTAKPNIENWIHELNLDPRYRVPAGLGTQVVQKDQEALMDAAWDQLGKVLEANRKIRQAQLAKAISGQWYVRHLLPVFKAFPERALLLTTPLQRRILVPSADAGIPALLPAAGTLVENHTVFHNVQESVLPYAMLSAPMRRVLRPRGKLVRALNVAPDKILVRINNGELQPAPPKETPKGAVTDTAVAAAAGVKGLPDGLGQWLKAYPWLVFLPLILAGLLILLLFILGLAAWPLVAGVALLGIFGWAWLRRWQQVETAAGLLIGTAQTPEAVDALPKSPDFVLVLPGAGTAARPSAGSSDSQEAVRFKGALRDIFGLVENSRETAKLPVKIKLDLPRLGGVLSRGIDPERTIPRFVWNGILLPDRMRSWIRTDFKEVMDYPEFDLPMYEPLAKRSAELFLPNINLIEQNSITLLQTNQKFIESYMVGLNHEFARELLWREYPTDQRGSYFRQFWDVSSFFKPGAPDAAALREQLRDIPPLHRWSRFSRLGEHDHREADKTAEEEVVLVIRGELLKKYPTAVIYAHKAVWDRGADGKILRNKPRLLAPLTAAEEAQPPLTKLKTPLYEAKVNPDIYFFGFDLTLKEASGGSGENESDDAGWFFVIKERPGEPRFGFDIESSGQLQIWNDLSWAHLKVSNGHIDLSSTAPENRALVLQNIANQPAGPDPGEGPSEAFLRWQQQQEDRHVRWNTNDGSNAAELAYIMYQVPVMVAVHAREMLPK